MEVREFMDPLQPSQPPTAYAGQTYYGMPAVKHSHYGLKTSAGFFFQGVGGSAQVIAALGDLLDREKNRNLIRAGRMLAFLASPLGPLLFVAALHTPRRWYNMLRIFRSTSPMSIGIWTLTAMGACNSLALSGTLLEDRGYEKTGKWMDRIFGSIAAAAGGLVSVYMGTELEETSTPIWIGAFPFLPPLIAATGFSNGTAALSLISSLSEDSSETRRRLKRIGSICTGSQAVFAGLMFHRLSRSAGASPLHRKAKAIIWPSIVAPSILQFLNGSSRRGEQSRRADVATLVGGFTVLTSLILAGKKSGKISGDYFQLTAGTPPVLKVAQERRPVQSGGRKRSSAAKWAGAALAAGLLGIYIRRRAG